MKQSIRLDLRRCGMIDWEKKEEIFEFMNLKLSVTRHT